ncbi:hypothetical protein [Streptomyces sp. NPDC047071]|uniref:hypothetical protein n=1 Tax=Streptomyces sp. NPDC047071 TaxID=3154808 RepID=UPI003455D7F2
MRAVDEDGRSAGLIAGQVEAVVLCGTRRAAFPNGEDTTASRLVDQGKGLGGFHARLLELA